MEVHFSDPAMPVHNLGAGPVASTWGLNHHVPDSPASLGARCRSSPHDVRVGGVAVDRTHQASSTPITVWRYPARLSRSLCSCGSSGRGASREVDMWHSMPKGCHIHVPDGPRLRLELVPPGPRTGTQPVTRDDCCAARLVRPPSAAGPRALSAQPLPRCQTRRARRVVALVGEGWGGLAAPTSDSISISAGPASMQCCTKAVTRVSAFRRHGHALRRTRLG